MIIEPVELDNSRDRIDYLKRLREKCTKTGALLIYDEVITGLRYPKYGVCNNYGVQPDMLLLGKAIGNGEKIAAVCGRKDIMEAEYFVSGTYHGQLLSLVTARKCFKLAKHDPEYDNEKLNSDSLYFVERLNDITKGLFYVEAWGCRGAFKGDYHLFLQEMAKAKVLFGPSLFINFHNIKHADDVLKMAERICDRIRRGDCKYEGRLPTGAFSSNMRKK